MTQSSERHARKFRGSLIIPLAILLGTPGVALAQTDASGALEDVIVTAQKRSQSVQDIPISISAVNAEEIARLGIKTPKDLESAVPNMRWVATDGTNVSNVFIRGVGDISFHVNQVGAVGLYMDEVSLNSPILSSFGLFDLDRVEVLRGPQNTLFGRNTTGGAIQFVTRKPTTDAWSGYGSVTGGNIGRNDIEGAVNIPIGERVALRLSAARFAQGDYLDNVFLNTREGAYQRSAGRAQLLWKVTDDLDALVSANMGTFRGDVGRYKQIGLGTPGSPGNTDCPFLKTNANPGNGCVDQTGFSDTGDFRQISANSGGLFQTNADGGTLRLDWRLPAATVTWLTGFEHADSKRSEDTDAGPSYIFNLDQHTNTDQWSQEIRATSKDEASIRWLAGAYYFNEAAHWDTIVRRANQALTNVTVPGLTVPETGVTSFIPFTLTHQKNEVYSAYGQLDFKVADKTRLSAGLRYTSEKKSGVVEDGIATDTAPLYSPAQFLGASEIDTLLAGGTQVPAGSALRPACPKPLPFTECYAYTPFSISNNTVGGRVALDQRFTDAVLGYVSFSRGFKAGSVSIAPLDYVARGGSIVTPEYLSTLELGIKSQAFANTLRVNAALFYNRWTDEQLFLPLATPGTGVNPVYVNVPRTESYGADLEIQWVPARDWLVTSAIGLLHSEVKEIGAALAAVNGATVGSVLLASPKLTWNGLIRKEWELGGGRASLQGNWAYTGSQHFDLVNSPDQIEPGYWVFNANAGYRFGDKQQYEVSLFGKNLTRTQYCVDRGSLAGVPFSDSANCAVNVAVRQYGVSVTAAF